MSRPSSSGRRGNLRLVKGDRADDDPLSRSSVQVRERSVLDGAALQMSSTDSYEAERALWSQVVELGDDAIGPEAPDAALIDAAIAADRLERSPVRVAIARMTRAARSALGIDDDSKMD